MFGSLLFLAFNAELAKVFPAWWEGQFASFQLPGEDGVKARPRICSSLGDEEICERAIVSGSNSKRAVNRS
jgi:hypothetical protein